MTHVYLKAVFLVAQEVVQVVIAVEVSEVAARLGAETGDATQVIHGWHAQTVFTHVADLVVVGVVEGDVFVNPIVEHRAKRSSSLGLVMGLSHLTLVVFIIRVILKRLTDALQPIPLCLVVLLKELLVNNSTVRDYLHGFELRSHHLDLVSDQGVKLVETQVA